MLVKLMMTQKECIIFLRHAYSEEGRGKILQISKNTIKLLQSSKPQDKISVVMLWDMIKTNDDGFATLLAELRCTTINDITSKLKKGIVEDSSLFDIVEKSAKNVEYDKSTRISVKKFRKLFVTK